MKTPSITGGVFCFTKYLYRNNEIMKHILNNLSEEVKNSIREQHTGGMSVNTDRFKTLMESKLGNVKPLVSEREMNEEKDNKADKGHIEIYHLYKDGKVDKKTFYSFVEVLDRKDKEELMDYIKGQKKDINESDDESEVTPNMIIKMLMDSAESTPQENYDDLYDWMQDVFSPVESELEDMGVDIDDLRMTYDDVVMSLWEDNYDDDFEDDDYELEESIRGNYRIRSWTPDAWYDEDDRAVNPDEIEDYEEEVEFGPDEYDRYMDYTRDIPNKWNFQYDKGYYDKHYKPGREIPIKIRKLRQR